MSRKKRTKEERDSSQSTLTENVFDQVVDATTKNSRTPQTNVSVIEASWIHNFFYLSTCWLWRFFTGPSRPKNPQPKDSRFKFIAEQLISTLPDSTDPLVTETTQKLLNQHRTIEDTEARRRLEKWACWIIIMYLISVFILVILNGLSRVFWPKIFTDCGFISDTVMYVILSTTTVNIIGLGIIVLKGHFPSDKKKKKNIENRDEITDLTT